MRRSIVFALVCATVIGCAPNDSVHENPGAATLASCSAENGLTYENFGRTFMETYCVPCHGSESSPYRNDPKAGKFDFRTLQGVHTNIAHVDVAAAAGPFAVNRYMPTSAPFPTEDERRKLGTWLTCAAP